MMLHINSLHIVLTSTIQFNAYDEDDTLLLEKSAVKGDL